MDYAITHIKDVLGNNYLGLEISPGEVAPFLDQMRELLGEEDFAAFTRRQQERDGGYHLTVINVAEYNRLIKNAGMDAFVNSLEPILKYPVDDLRMIGLGRAEKGGDVAFYVACRSAKLDAVRERYGLGEKDLHITVGFRHRDVFGVPKREVLKKGQNFTKLLGQEFYKMGNWDFVKDIGNFDCDRKSGLYPVEITDTVAKFRCGDHYIGVAHLPESGGFRVVYKYDALEQLPRMPETEIVRIFKKP